MTGAGWTYRGWLMVVSAALGACAMEPEPEIESVTVKNDSNKDGFLNPGETASLEIHVRNSGTSNLVAPKFSIASESDLLSVVDGFSGGCTGWFVNGTIAPGDKGLCHPPPTVEASPSTPIGSNVAFSLVITDDQSNKWELTFSVPVK